MKLLFIRHADPDYVNDSLTDTGKKEAELLSKIIGTFGIDDVYQSPLGRAKETAAYSLPVLGKEAETCDWLKEFPAVFDPNLSESARQAYKTELKIDEATGKYQGRILWDVLPSYFEDHPELFGRNTWRDSELVRNSDGLKVYDYVTSEFDKLLAGYGYERDGDIYRVTEANDKKIAFFCHFGVTCVLLSRLWNMSPFSLWQYMAMAPTSVSELASEEREQGKAIFRALSIGDTKHLYMAGQEPSFSARFCEKFDNAHERH